MLVIILYILGGFATADALYRDRLRTSDDIEPIAEGLMVLFWPLTSVVFIGAACYRISDWRARGRANKE
jgi:hypothetical protein